jgi:hypothetical protein
MCSAVTLIYESEIYESVGSKSASTGRLGNPEETSGLL